MKKMHNEKIVSIRLPGWAAGKRVWISEQYLAPAVNIFKANKVIIVRITLYCYMKKENRKFMSANVSLPVTAIKLGSCKYLFIQIKWLLNDYNKWWSHWYHTWLFRMIWSLSGFSWSLVKTKQTNHNNINCCV